MKNGITLCYAEKSDLVKWPKMTSAVEHSQCLLINFNIFNDKKILRCMTMAAVHRYKI